MVRKAIIMGASGRDFHNFNVYFRDNSNYTVVAFTADPDTLYSKQSLSC